jgi:hypothetical protein
MASPKCKNIVFGSKRFIFSRLEIMDNIMALKNHSKFKFIHNNRILTQSKDKRFVFEMSVDLPDSGATLVK